MRRSEVSTDDKTADTRCFPCASAQGASPVTSTKNTGTRFLCFFLWVRYAGIEGRQNKEKIKKQAITLFFLRKLWYIYIADINCRCRLAVWRQLPKLISAGPTPITCSKHAKPFRVSFFCGGSRTLSGNFAPEKKNCALFGAKFGEPFTREVGGFF